MGLYLYGCYSPKRNVKVALPDGKVVEACMFRYLCKPYHDSFSDDVISLNNGSRSAWHDEWGYGHKMTYLKVCKIKKLWEGEERPRYALHVQESESLKEHPEWKGHGTLSYSSKGTPPIWLEENYGDIHIGEYRRTRGGLWTPNDVYDSWKRVKALTDNKSVDTLNIQDGEQKQEGM